MSEIIKVKLSFKSFLQVDYMSETVFKAYYFSSYAIFITFIIIYLFV